MQDNGTPWRWIPRRLALAAALAAGMSVSAPASAGDVDRGAVAQPPSPTPVPVVRLLDDGPALLAWLAARHPDVAAAGARVRQAEALVDQARVIPNPTLGVGVGGLAFGERNPSSLGLTDTLNLTVGVSETVELGKRGPRAKAATLRRDASRAAAVDVLVNRLADARDALARTIYFQERRRVLEERLASARNVVELEQVRLQHGDISGIELDRLELEAEAVARELADTQGDLDGALADCSARLVGDCAAGSGAAATMDAVDRSAPIAVDPRALDELVTSRPDVRAARLATDAARTDAVLFRRQALPDPTFGVQYTRDYLVSAGNQPNTLMATISIPLPLFDHGQHLARQADAAAEELAQGAWAAEVRARADARTLLFREQLLKQRLETLARTSLPKALAVLQASDDAYHHGQLSLTDLIIVRREHAALLLASMETRYALFAVRNELHRTLGLTSPGAQSLPARPASR